MSDESAVAPAGPGDVERRQTRDILATLREAFVELDSELRVVSANDPFYEIFQVGVDETEQRRLFELGDGEWDIPGLQDLLRRVVDYGHIFDNFEVQRTFPRVGQKVLLLSALSILHAGSRTGRILVAIEDVTERRQGFIALENSERKYRRLFESAQDGILILTADTGQITDANPYVERILGRSRAELLGKQLWDVGLLSGMEENREKFDELREKGYVRYDHLPLQTEEGIRTEVEFVSNVYEDDGHQVIQCNIRDIGVRRRLEQEAERQAEIVVELDRRKDEFLAMLSHELRSPLATIVNAVHILGRQHTETPIQRAAREAIQRQSAQLQYLIDDLLEVSRITTGRIQMLREATPLCVVVEQAIDAIRPEFARKRHEFTASIPTKSIWVEGDAVRLHQVVVNLLTNAAKYTEEGGRTALDLDEEDGSAILRLRDNGVGIAPDMLPRVFELFAQGERSLARSDGGMGIGLALVARIVELHGGTVEVDSVLGEGSEFVVRLPTIADPEPDLGAPLTGTDDEGEAPLRLLVVEDNPDLARTFQLIFEDDGHEISVAHDGVTALQSALDFQPDAVLLDIGLPGWDGYEVARRIRSEARLDGVVLIAMTGYGRDSDRAQAFEVGFDHHIVKPPDFDRLETLFATIPRRHAHA